GPTFRAAVCVTFFAQRARQSATRRAVALRPFLLRRYRRIDAARRSRRRARCRASDRPPRARVAQMDEARATLTLAPRPPTTPAASCWPVPVARATTWTSHDHPRDDPRLGAPTSSLFSSGRPPRCSPPATLAAKRTAPARRGARSPLPAHALGED